MVSVQVKRASFLIMNPFANHNIKICTDCSGLIEEEVFLSGSTFGAVFYTDGKVESPMLPEQFALIKCPHCLSLLWSNDLEMIKYDDIQVNSVKPYLKPDFYAYLYKLDNDIDNKKEEYLRIKAWHVGNDQRRKSDNKSEISKYEIDNLKALEGMHALNDDSLVFQAEIKRELSLFDDSIALLENFEDFSMDVSCTIRRLSFEKNPFVSLVDEYCEEFYDNNVKKTDGYRVNDNKHGLWIERYPDGSKKSSAIYEDGLIVK